MIDALQSEITDVITDQVPITYQSAISINGGSEPPIVTQHLQQIHHNIKLVIQMLWN